MYVLEDIAIAFAVVEEVTIFARKLANYLNSDVAKYKSLSKFKIQVGACFGCFYKFVFTRKNNDEQTTIGYAANYGAKLQSICKNDCIAISSNVYEQLESEKKKVFLKSESDEVKMN